MTVGYSRASRPISWRIWRRSRWQRTLTNGACQWRYIRSLTFWCEACSASQCQVAERGQGLVWIEGLRSRLLAFYPLQAFNTVKLLNAFYKVVSTNTDGNVEFVSTMEGSHTLWAQIYQWTLKGAALMMGSFFPLLCQRTTIPSTAPSGIRRRRPTCGHVLTSHTLRPQSGQAITQQLSSSMKVLRRHYCVFLSSNRIWRSCWLYYDLSWFVSMQPGRTCISSSPRRRRRKHLFTITILFPLGTPVSFSKCTFSKLSFFFPQKNSS